MISKKNDYSTNYFELIGGFRCEVTGRNHNDHGEGRAVTREEALNLALVAYHLCREKRENASIGLDEETMTL